MKIKMPFAFQLIVVLVVPFAWIVGMKLPTRTVNKQEILTNYVEFNWIIIIILLPNIINILRFYNFVVAGSEDVLKFQGNDTVVDYFKLVLRDGNSLLIGAR